MGHPRSAAIGPNDQLAQPCSITCDVMQHLPSVRLSRDTRSNVYLRRVGKCASMLHLCPDPSGRSPAGVPVAGCPYTRAQLFDHSLRPGAGLVRGNGGTPGLRDFTYGAYHPPRCGIYITWTNDHGRCCAWARPGANAMAYHTRCPASAMIVPACSASFLSRAG